MANFVTAFDDLVATSFNEYLNLSGQIGDLVKVHADMVNSAVKAQREFISIASSSKQPKVEQLTQLLKPTSDYIQSIQEFRAKNRASAFFNHLSAISESITALAWVTIAPAPAPFVKEMLDASQFYTNKVLVAYKDKDKKHIDWAKSWLAFLTELQKYVKYHHTTGLTWNAKGGDYVANGATGAGGPPPPPPPPPPVDLSALSIGDSGAAGDDARLALMKEISRGTDITKSLRHVSDQQKTHKNPELRSTSVVHPSSKPVSAVTGKVSSVAVKPPKFELEGKKWLIEYQVNANQLTVESEEMNQSISIYRCSNTVIIVKGKANSITVDSCTKCGIVFDDIVSFVEIINSQSTQVQSLGSVPTINVEKSDSTQVYLSTKSIDAEIVTAKSSSINVSVPDKTGDFVEHAIPEQFKSKWTGKGFKTEPTDICS